MATVSEPKHTQELAENPTNILAIWKRLWPLIISVGLFVLLGSVWNEPVSYNDYNCPILNKNTIYIALATNGMIPILIISRLFSGLGTKQTLPVWIRCIIRVGLFVVGTILVTLISSDLFSDSNAWVIGIIIWVSIGIVLLVPRGSKQPTHYQDTVWLLSLLLLIITLYLLAWPLGVRVCYFEGFGPGLGADV